MAQKLTIELCDDCIKALVKLTDKDGQKVISLLANSSRGLTQKEIRNKVNLSQTQATGLTQELVGKGFVNFDKIGRSHLYYLTSNGRRLIELFSKKK